MTRVHKPLIDAIVEVLDADSRVVACWLEGSIARGEDDDFSDIDVWIAVKDTHYAEFVRERELFAKKLGPVVSVLYPKTEGTGPEIDSFKIIFEDHPSFQSLDVDVQKQSRRFSFTQDAGGEECKVLFDKAKVIRYQELNAAEVEQYARELFEDIVMRFWSNLPKTTVHMKRGDLLQAWAWYQDRLKEFVTLCRIEYTPEKVEWEFKDIEYDMSEDLLEQIRELVPELSERSMRKAIHRLAKCFLKQSEQLGKRLGCAVPEALSKKVIRELD